MSFRFSPGRGEEGGGGGGGDFFVKCNFADRAFEFLHSRICGRAVIGQSRRKLAQQEALCMSRKQALDVDSKLLHRHGVLDRS